MNKKYLEVREMFPDGRASDNLEIYVIPVLRETETSYITNPCFVHNVVGCTPTDHKKKRVTWRKGNGLRAGDIPCEYTPTFTIIRVNKSAPPVKKHHVRIGDMDGEEKSSQKVGSAV